MNRWSGRRLVALFLILLAISAYTSRAGAESAYKGVAGTPRIGLVLSGGGARGFAHIGILQAIEAQGIPLYCIVGSSMGAVVGGLYSSGYSPAEIDSLLRRYSWEDMFSDKPDRRLMYSGRKEVTDRHLVQVRFNGLKPQWVRSLSTGQRVSQVLSDLVWRAPIQSFGDFDQLMVRFRAVATNLETGQRVELGDGDLAEAMRASMSVPFLFQPVELDGRMLIDGGIAANIPVETARKLGADIVIAVDVTSPLRHKDQLREAWEMADQIVSIMQVDPNRRSLEEADLVIRPGMPPVMMNDFGQREQQIAEGARAMHAHVKDLRALLERAFSAGGRVDEPPSRNLDLCLEIWDGSAWLPLESDDGEHWESLNTDCAFLDEMRREEGTWSADTVLPLRRELLECGCFQEVELDTLPLGLSGSDHASEGFRLRLLPNSVVRFVRLEGLGLLRDDLSRAAWESLEVGSLDAAVNLGRPLRRDRLDAALEALLVRMRRAGYTLCRLDTLFLKQDTLMVLLNPGQLDELRVEGLTHLRPGVLLKEFRPRPGEIFTVSAADRSISRLFASGLFEQIHLRLDREAGRNVAVMNAAERDFPALRAGFHYGSAREGEGFAQLLWENLFSRSLRGEITWLMGARRSEQRGSLESDRIWKTWLTTRLTALHRNAQFRLKSSSSADSLMRRVRVDRELGAIQLRFGQQIQGLGVVSLTGALEWNREEVSAQRESSQQVRLGIISVVDSRDRICLTRRGEYHRVAFEQLVPGREGEDPAFRAALEFDVWRSIGSHTGQLSLLLGRTDSPHRRDQFEFGGDAWVRTLPTAELAGRQAVGLRTAWQMHLAASDWGDWYASLRWSLLGQRQDLEGWPRRRDLLQEAGVGLHLDSLVGELALGLARLTDPGPAEQPGWKLWVELGYPF